ncbi:histone acetyltransferase [Histoplasma capsulatum var. duboisii H88]|uniref:histone acetyltransferase n=2 Tax=Ajellomyces capsulatus (strain H88) TaxID=544711 RepID=F0UFI8_AJEC8|nr:histone acetyltransferase [Histoplasma capsulatum var. duboisii H88]
MDKAVSQSIPASSTSSTQNLDAKRAAVEEPSFGPDAKRIKRFHDGLIEPDAKTPALTIVPFPEKPAVLEERNGEIQFRVVNNDGSRESTIILTGLKCLFQKQLPKMPKDYIARLVYDRAHLSMAIVKIPLEVIGGITFREFRDRKFAEIVFCAVSSHQQVKGYGAHLMFHLKDYVRATSPQWASAVIAPIDPLSIPASATGWSPDMDKLAREPRHGRHFNELRRFLNQIQNHKQAWPFLNPVNRDEVPDYYNVIVSPMDLSTMEERLECDSYPSPKDLVADLKLIFSNCRRYNDASTVYAKCAVKLEKYMWSLIKKIPEWADLLED